MHMYHSVPIQAPEGLGDLNRKIPKGQYLLSINKSLNFRLKSLKFI